jgi:hypothetical protein
MQVLLFLFAASFNFFLLHLPAAAILFSAQVVYIGSAAIKISTSTKPQSAFSGMLFICTNDSSTHKNPSSDEALA